MIKKPTPAEYQLWKPPQKHLKHETMKRTRKPIHNNCPEMNWSLNIPHHKPALDGTDPFFKSFNTHYTCIDR